MCVRASLRKRAKALRESLSQGRKLPRQPLSAWRRHSRAFQGGQLAHVLRVLPCFAVSIRRSSIRDISRLVSRVDCVAWKGWTSVAIPSTQDLDLDGAPFWQRRACQRAIACSRVALEANQNRRCKRSRVIDTSVAWAQGGSRLSVCDRSVKFMHSCTRRLRVSGMDGIMG
mgnify:CR=1 FL=1